MTTCDHCDILLVEDTAADAELVRLALKKTHPDCEIRHVYTGEEGLGMLRSGELGRNIGMVLLDLNLPGISGFDVLESIRSDQELAHLPVVVLTTSDSEEEVRRLYRGNANAFVVKPLGLSGYLEVISAVHGFWAETARIPTRDRGTSRELVGSEVA